MCSSTSLVSRNPQSSSLSSSERSALIVILVFQERSALVDVSLAQKERSAPPRDFPSSRLPQFSASRLPDLAISRSRLHQSRDLSTSRNPPDFPILRFLDFPTSRSFTSTGLCVFVSLFDYYLLVDLDFPSSLILPISRFLYISISLSSSCSPVFIIFVSLSTTRFIMCQLESYILLVVHNLDQKYNSHWSQAPGPSVHHFPRLVTLPNSAVLPLPRATKNHALLVLCLGSYHIILGDSI